jgi:hypothetical protein
LKLFERCKDVTRAEFAGPDFVDVFKRRFEIGVGFAKLSESLDLARVGVEEVEEIALGAADVFGDEVEVTHNFSSLL